MHDQINGCHIHKEKRLRVKEERERIMTGNKAKANTAFSGQKNTKVVSMYVAC